MSDYLDEMEAGMKDFLTDVVASDEPADEVYRNKHWQKYNANVLSSGVKLWRTLKRMTRGEAKDIVKSVGSQDGFVAWQKLAERFEQGIETRTGTALAELGGLIRKPAKGPKETKVLLTELDKRIKEVHDLGDTVSDSHAKAVLIGFLDPT